MKVEKRIIQLLAQSQEKNTFALILDIISDTSWSTTSRLVALERVISQGKSTVIPTLIKITQNPNDPLHKAAFTAYFKIIGARGPNALKFAVNSKKSSTYRFAALSALYAQEPGSAIDIITRSDSQ